MGSMWEILDIVSTYDEKIIKQAYLKKLKKTNPEEKAEAFQALRNAYESALKYAKSQFEKNSQGSIKNFSDYSPKKYTSNEITFNIVRTIPAKAERDNNYLYKLAHKLVNHAKTISEPSAIYLFKRLCNSKLFEKINSNAIFSDAIFLCFIRTNRVPYDFFYVCAQHYGWSFNDYHLMQSDSEARVVELKETLQLMKYINFIKDNPDKKTSEKLFFKIIANFKKNNKFNMNRKQKNGAVKFIKKLQSLYPKASFSFLKIPYLLQLCATLENFNGDSWIASCIYRIGTCILYVKRFFLAIILIVSIILVIVKINFYIHPVQTLQKPVQTPHKVNYVNAVLLEKTFGLKPGALLTVKNTKFKTISSTVNRFSESAIYANHFLSKEEDSG